MRFKSALLSFILIYAFGNIVHSQNFKFIQNDSVLVLLDNDVKIYEYQVKNKSLNGKFTRSNYLHPLYDLDGNVLTEDFPNDHPHHRGIFWSWHQLRVGSKSIGDPWVCEGVEWSVENISTNIYKEYAEFYSDVYWIDTSTSSKIISEKVNVIYKKLSKSSYELDFNIKFHPIVDSVFIGGSDDIKGYGGFSVRLSTKDSLSFFNKKGEITPANTAVNVGNWIGISISDADNKGVIITVDKNNENFIGWILRSKNSMQNPAIPGRDIIELKKSAPLVLQNKIIVYDSAEDLYSILKTID